MNKLAIIVIIPVLIAGVMTTAGAVNMGIIKQIESGGNSRAVSSAGARGLYQIMSITLKSYNQRHRKDYTGKDLFNGEINRKIAGWYLHQRIPAMLRYYEIPVNTKTIIWSYNAGISRCKKGVMPESTRQYIKQYRRLSNERYDS